MKKEESKKPDLRDSAGPATTVVRNDRKFAEEPLQESRPHTVKPGPEVQTPGQTTKQ